jgi:hypothetical protein
MSQDTAKERKSNIVECPTCGATIGKNCGRAFGLFKTRGQDFGKNHGSRDILMVTISTTQR